MNLKIGKLYKVKNNNIRFYYYTGVVNRSPWAFLSLKEKIILYLGKQKITSETMDMELFLYKDNIIKVFNSSDITEENLKEIM